MIGASCALALWLATSAALAGAPPALGSAEIAELERRGAVIGEIVVVNGDVFDLDDPEQDGLLYRVANRLHRETRPGVIRDQLLFAEGDPFSPRLLAESERLLRATRFLYDAEIRPLRVRGNVVDVEVVTRDVWTLTGGLGLSRSGGENSTRFEVQDTSFFGSGKDVTIEQASDVDRTSTLLRYRDPNVAGRRFQIEAVYADHDRGSHHKLYVERPFFSLDTRWALSLRAVLDDRVDGLYRDGEVAERLRHRRDWVEAWGGVSRGLVDGHIRRFTFGATFVDSEFADAGDDPLTDWDLPDRDRPVTTDGTTAPTQRPGRRRPPRGHDRDEDDAEEPEPIFAIPAPRRLVYPWIGFEWLEDAYVEAEDVDSIGRTEDRYLGRRFTARLGYAAQGLGSDRDAVIFKSALTETFRLGRLRTLELETRLDGRYRLDDVPAADDGDVAAESVAGFEDVLASGMGRFLWRNFGEHLLVVRLGADYAYRLDGERQLLLGGDNGLRGYPLRYQDGDRRLLFSVEQRFYSDWRPFELFNVGAAVFFDMGRAWFDGPGGPEIESRWLRDVGFGLRLSSSRAGRGTMTHLDVAFPLDGDGSIDDVQWLITTSESF